MAAIAPIHVQDRRFSGLLTENLFKIPELQRPFAWGEPQVNDLVADLLTIVDHLSSADADVASPQHFFGTVVYQTVPDDPRKSVIDGQQRLTAITVLLAVLRSELEQLRSQIDQAGGPAREGLLEQVNAHSAEILLYLKTAPDGNNERKIRLQPSPEIAKTYTAIINQQPYGDIDEDSGPANSLRYAAAEFRLQLIRERARFEDQELAGQLRHLVNVKRAIIECLIFVSVETSSPNAVYDLFESLNAKGEPLNVVDLLKVWILSNMQGDEREAKISSEMREVATPYDQSYKPSDYVFHYFQARLPGRTPNRSSWPKAYALDVRTSLFEDQPLQNLDVEDLVKLRDKISTEVGLMAQWLPTYRKLTSSPVQYPYPNPSPLHADRLNTLLGSLQHKTALPLLLSASQALSPDEYFDLVHMVEKVFFRLKLMCGKRETHLKTAYSNLLSQIKGGAYSTDSARSVLSQMLAAEAPMAMFKSALIDKLTYDSNNGKRIKYFLWMLELYSGEGGPLPQWYDLDNFWIEHIHAQANEAEALDAEDEVHRLGNLCLLTSQENISLGKRTFGEKKQIVEGWASDGHHLTCVHSNSVFKDCDTWDSAQIAAREASLQVAAEKAFSLTTLDR